VVDILAATAAEGRWIATEGPFDRSARRARCRAMLERDDACLLVATVGGTIAGHLGARSRQIGLIEFGMAVAPAHRRAGIGRALIAACIDWARNRHAYKIILEVFPHNTAARALYRACGFVEEGYFRHHVRRANGELWDAIPMAYMLPDGGERRDETPRD